MTNERLPLPELSPEMMLDLAAAIAERSIKENDRENAYVTETTGFVENIKSSELKKNLETGLAAFQLSLLLNPHETIDAASSFDVMQDDAALRMSLISNGEEATDEVVAAVRETVSSQLAILQESFFTDEDKKIDFAERVQAAQEVAAAHDVEIGTVFREDELYKEVIRTQLTPQLFAERWLKTYDKVAENMFSLVFAQLVEPGIMAACRDGEYTADELPQLREEVMQDAAVDPEFMATVNDAVNSTRYLGAVIIRSNLAHFWGPDAISELNETTQAALAVTNEGVNTELIEEVASRSRKEQDLVRVICQEYGWDPADLTSEQLGAINSSLAMQELKSSFID